MFSPIVLVIKQRAGLYPTSAMLTRSIPIYPAPAALSGENYWCSSPTTRKSWPLFSRNTPTYAAIGQISIFSGVRGEHTSETYIICSFVDSSRPLARPHHKSERPVSPASRETRYPHCYWLVPRSNQNIVRSAARGSFSTDKDYPVDVDILRSIKTYENRAIPSVVARCVSFRVLCVRFATLWITCG